MLSGRRSGASSDLLVEAEQCPAVAVFGRAKTETSCGEVRCCLKWPASWMVSSAAMKVMNCFAEGSTFAARST